MEPTYFDGDVVFYKEYSKKNNFVELGDVIIFKHPIKDINLIKRVTGISYRGIEVSGDNKYFSDDSNYFGLININNIIGLVTSHIKKHDIEKIKTLFN